MSFFRVLVNGCNCKGHFQSMGKESCGKVLCSDYVLCCVFGHGLPADQSVIQYAT